MVKRIVLKKSRRRSVDLLEKPQVLLEKFLAASDGPIELLLSIDDYQDLEDTIKVLFDDASVERIKKAMANRR